VRHTREYKDDTECDYCGGKQKCNQWFDGYWWWRKEYWLCLFCGLTAIYRPDKIEYRKELREELK